MRCSSSGEAGFLQRSEVGFGSCVTRIAGPNGDTYTRDEGRSFEAGSQVPASNRCKLLSSTAMVVSVAVRREDIAAGEVERGERKRTADDVSPPRPSIRLSCTVG